MNNTDQKRSVQSNLIKISTSISLSISFFSPTLLETKPLGLCVQQCYIWGIND